MTTLRNVCNVQEQSFLFSSLGAGCLLCTYPPVEALRHRSSPASGSPAIRHRHMVCNSWFQSNGSVLPDSLPTKVRQGEDGENKKISAEEWQGKEENLPSSYPFSSPACESRQTQRSAPYVSGPGGALPIRRLHPGRIDGLLERLTRFYRKAALESTAVTAAQVTRTRSLSPGKLPVGPSYLHGLDP